MSMVDLALAHVDKERAALLRAWLADDDIPDEFKVWARREIRNYTESRSWIGETMAYSLVWTILVHELERAEHRRLAEMVLFDRTIRAKLRWAELNR